MKTTITEAQKSSPTYRKAFAMGVADAAAGFPFSRFVLQHDVVCRVEFSGHATPAPATEDFIGRAYVAGCCAK